MKPATQRRAEATIRQAAHDALTTQEKLDKALERGHWNSREAKRLRKELAR